MKLYAQHGFGPGEKITSGLTGQVLDGAIIGAKDTSEAQIGNLISQLQQINPDADFLFDCHYYASAIPVRVNNRLGGLESYPYWGTQTRNNLYFLNQANIENDITTCLQFQETLPVSSFIAPNIVVRQTLNSRDGAISSLFINRAATISRQINSNRSVLATLALSREALLDVNELEQFIHLITSLSSPPDGFYLILSLTGPLQSELFHSDVIASLLYLVSSLKLNGFQVVVGYSDLVGPVLAAAGADAGCSGWFQTLRMFSMNRFEPSAGGGKQPRPQYLSMRLFNRIFIGELLSATALEPSVRNNLDSDAYYFEGNEVYEPENKTLECLQSWDALKALQDQISAGSIRDRLARLTELVGEARALYESLRMMGVTFETKSSEAHLVPILQGITNFQQTL